MRFSRYFLILTLLLTGLVAVPVWADENAPAAPAAPAAPDGAEQPAEESAVKAEEPKQDKAPNTYAIEEQGRGTWRATFDKKMDTPSAQWIYAKETRDKGWLKKADRRMLYLVRRWPNSKEAPWAARARADMMYERRNWKDAFRAYQYLVDNYSSRMADYDTVLQRQYEIAVKIMNRKRMRWIFGGFKAPEYAVEYFEQVIRNGPQWTQAPMAQFMIGKCHQDTKEWELAISAYGVLGYRYPDSVNAENAAWQQIQCLDKLRNEYPASNEILDRTLTATTVFLSTYPRSEHKDDIIKLRNRLYEVKAGKSFDEAAFYARVPKEPEAAVIYYEKMIEEYPKSQMVPSAKKRIAALKELMAAPLDADRPSVPRSKPLPFLKDSTNVDG
jgi:outer membrane protein assembly factor BamD (BamD/ComL family)